MLKAITVTAVALFLTGCVTDTTAQAPTASLGQIKQMILASKERYWKDTASIRDARIGTTAACIEFSGDCACIETNAKNSFGAYSGLQTQTVVYSGGVVTDIRKSLAAEACHFVEEFPELNGGFRSATR